MYNILSHSSYKKDVKETLETMKTPCPVYVPISCPKVTDVFNDGDVPGQWPSHHGGAQRRGGHKVGTIFNIDIVYKLCFMPGIQIKVPPMVVKVCGLLYRYVFVDFVYSNIAFYLFWESWSQFVNSTLQCF